MPDSQPRPIVFHVPGQNVGVAGISRGGEAAGVTSDDTPVVKHAIAIASNRDGGLVRAEAIPGEDIVVLQIADGPELHLHPETAADLMRAQRPRDGTARGGLAEDSNGDIVVPMQLSWSSLEDGAAMRGATRGFGGVLLKAFKVLTGFGKDDIADFAVSQIVTKMDGQVDEGVYALDREALHPLKGTRALAAVPAAPAGEPTLVLIHGTFSSTHGTFSKLWSDQHQLVTNLFSFYGGRVYALDHRTLAATPIDNALTLAKALPKNAKLHLLTHSRGGLVAEVLARVCATPDDAFTHFRDDPRYEPHLTALTELAKTVKAQNITVERMVRVACPVRGTLLASKRLDAYISVLKWALELARLPVAPELVGLLGAVAKRKADPSELPGLEVQMPDSKLVTWLHAIDKPIPGDLRVIAGDLQGDSVVSWLKTLLADSFYWTDNDLVVQTRSMYGGAPRANSAQFVFDQGGGVSHFNYFRNDRTAQAIVEGLTSHAPPSFNTIGPLSWAGQSSEGVRGAFATQANDATQRDKPLVFLIPGIVGSNLKIKDDRIWLGWRLLNGFKRLEYRGAPDDVLPDGPIGLTYDRLSDYLAETHAVVEFAYDWRRPIEDEAARLAEQVDAALKVRESNGKPVRIVAHSMGGLVARTMQIVNDGVWSRMMAREGARVLMLGTPNAGLWAPMQVLSGDDTFGNMLAAAGAPFQGHEARQVMAGFPGLLQLQADLLAGRGLDREETWKRIADRDLAWLERHNIWHRLPIQLKDSRWGVPTQRVLDAAKALRTKLDSQLTEATAIFRNNVVLVIGRAGATPDSFEQSDAGELVYLDLPEDGDGRVTRQRAVLPGVRTWKVNTDHGNLPRQRDAFEAYLQLLNNGSTSLLTEVASSAASRGAAPEVAAYQRSRPSRAEIETRPPQNPNDVLRGGRDATVAAMTAPRGAALRVTVVNGDLTFVGDPLMVGHYRSLQLTGTERVMNDLIGDTMQESLRIGRYPVAIGSNQIFDNVRAHPFRDLPLPQAVIVVGLADEGSLRPEGLIDTVRHGALAWAQRAAERPRAVPRLFDLATTLIGSGGAGMSPGESAQCIVQGVKEANELLEQQETTKQWPRVGHLRLIELYLDRATEAWQAVRVQASGSAALYSLDDEIDEGHGGFRRTADAGYRGADYDFVSALTSTDNGDTRIAYSIDTKRARTELRDESVQLRLVRSMVSAASSAGNRDPQIGRSLFKLLIPPAIKPFLGGSNAVVLELDGGSAGVPWELLDTPGAGPNALPWAIRAKMLRKLRVPDATSPAQDATADASVLVIGEPECDRRRYPPLFGAREEAVSVAGLLTNALRSRSGAVRSLIRPENRREPGPDAHAVVNALLERSWRIVHIAGHGEPPEWVTKQTTRGIGDPRGVVLSNDIFLGPREMKKMTAVPELVFVNCCHLASRGSEETLEAQERRRAEFAVGVAEALIAIGVRCVVAAAWAVDDQAATTFATSFYRSLLQGSRFMNAVAEARAAAYALGGNTWAAYQCYGDPDWIFTSSVGDAQAPRAAVGNEFAGIGSAPALKVTLDSIAVQAGKTVVRHDEYAEKLEFLDAHFGKRWGERGEIAQGFGVAWTELGNREKALPYLERAVRAPDGSATIQSVEQLCNVRARLSWDRVLTAYFERKDASAANAVSAQAALDEAIKNGLAGVTEAISLLDQITAYEPTMERESLRASAHKRKAMIHRVSGNADEERKSIKEMQRLYQRALEVGRSRGTSDLFYPGLNILAGIVASKPKLPCRFDPQVVEEVKRTLDRRAKEDPDFWSVSGERELELYQAVSQCQLAKARAAIAAGYANLYSRVSAPRKWDSIFDTAHFVLTRYASINPEETERAAAEALLDQLQSFTPYKHLGGVERAYVE